MNWGGFAGGFSQGLDNGMRLGKNINDLIKEDRIDKLRKQGMEEATAARAASVSDMVQDGGLAGRPAGTQAGQDAPNTADVQAYPVAAPTTTVRGAQDAAEPAPALAMPAATPAPGVAASPAATGLPTQMKRFRVGGASFDTREEAIAHADKHAPSVTDLFMKNAVPKISEAYLAQGDVEKATAWEKYASGKETQKNMKTWADMQRAATMGDFEKAGEHMFELYKRYDDGVTPMSKEVVKDKDGKFTGFNVRLKNDASGAETTQFIPQSQMVEMGLTALSPPAMFEQTYKTKQAADQLRAKAAIDAANDQRTLTRDLVVGREKSAATAVENEKKRKNDVKIQGMKGDQRLEQISIEQQIKDAAVGTGEKKKIQSKVEALRAAGYNDEQLNGMMPALVGAGDYKKRTSPEEARRLLLTERVKDPLFSNQPPAKQQEIIDRDMDTIYGKQAATVPNPVAPPTAKGGGAAPAGKGTLYMMPDGRMVRVGPDGKPIK